MRDRRRKNQRFSFESLEHRLTMAGNVVAGRDGSGNLTITGDANSNAIEIEAGSQPGEYIISGKVDATTNTQTLINGLSQVRLTNISGKVIATLGGGNDQFSIKGGTNNAGLLIDGGTGNDIIRVGLFQSVSSRTSATRTTLNGTVDINSGDGDDQIFVGRVSGGANYTLNAGVGDDKVEVYNAFSGTFITYGGTGADQISVGYLTVSDYLNIDGGADNDLISFYCSRTTINVYYGGSRSFQLNGGAGYDFVAADVNRLEQDFSVYGGDDSDTVLFARSVLDYGFRIDLGAGDDNAIIGKYYAVEQGQTVLRNAGTSAQFLTLDMGIGNDRAEVAANVIASVFADGGFGNDDLTMDTNVIGYRMEYEGGDGIDRFYRHYNSFAFYIDHGVDYYFDI
jgi:hypothetical protein